MSDAAAILIPMIGVAVALLGGCLIGWGAGDLSFGPKTVERRAKRMMVAGVPIAVGGLIAFVILLEWTIP